MNENGKYGDCLFNTKINNNKEGRFIMSSVIRESGKQGGRALYDVPARGEEDK